MPCDADRSRGYRAGCATRPSAGLRPPYVLLHSLAHALIRQFSVECGYAAASLIGFAGGTTFARANVRTAGSDGWSPLTTRRRVANCRDVFDERLVRREGLGVSLNRLDRPGVHGPVAQSEAVIWYKEV